MNIAIFGGTGKTGLQLMQHALDLGYNVSALVRTPSNLHIQHDNLTVVQGDVLNQADVDKTVAGQNAVICSLGIGSSLSKTTLRADGTAHILNAMRTHESRRLIIISAMGSGDSHVQLGLGAKLIMKTFLRNAMADHAAQEALVMQSDLEWIIVRPSGLTDDPQSGNIAHGLGTDRTLGSGRISRADVAQFTLAQLTSDHYLGKAVSVT